MATMTKKSPENMRGKVNMESLVTLLSASLQGKGLRV